MNDLDARPRQKSFRSSAALALVTGLLAVSGRAHAEPSNPPAPPATTTPAPPAPDADRPVPTPASEAPGVAAPAAAKAAAPTADDDDSDESPAAPPPDTSPSALEQGRQTAKHQPPAVPDDPRRMDDGLMGTHQEHWLIGVGLRETFVTNAGFDPFSTNNALPQVSIDAGRAFFASGPFSLAGLLVFDAGSVKATARGADTSLGVYRITAGAEGRYHFWRRFYVFGRIAPGALYSNATLTDPVAAVDRHSNSWAFTSDFSLGTAFEFAGEQRGASSRPRGWIGADGGYGWAQTTKLVFESNGSSASGPARPEPIRLGDLAVRGGFFRVNGTITF
jgi:hypothetical protein